MIAKLQAAGMADKTERKIQNAIGGVKDTIKGKWVADPSVPSFVCALHR
jgi:uncharacterized protein YjbJ (UPF0337 family)